MKRYLSPVDEALKGHSNTRPAGDAAETDAPTQAPPRTKKSKEPVAFFDSSRGTFWTKNSRGDWIQFSEASLKRLLKYKHFSEFTDRDGLAAVLDKELLTMQHEQDVSYAGAIAGYGIGLQTVCGNRVLVTTGPRLLTPKDGDWFNLRKFVEQLLGDQVRVFYGWAKAALRSLYGGPPWRPGQMLALAGPPGSGKSLLQNLLTEMLGGRIGKPYRYMIGETAFNSDLLQAEHLMIEDEPASTDLRIRRHFGSQLKNMIVNEVQSMHGKGRDAMAVTPYWRVSISLNDEPENLMVLPPLDDSLCDKLTLLRARPFDPPYAADDINARNKWRARLSLELPAFAAWLRAWRVPAAMVNVRYGVNAFQDELLVKALHETSPEFALLELIDSLQIWNIDREPFVGTATEVQEALQAKDRHGRVGKLLYYASSCGTYLGRLCHKCPSRVKQKNTARSREYTITPP